MPDTRCGNRVLMSLEDAAVFMSEYSGACVRDARLDLHTLASNYPRLNAYRTPPPMSSVTYAPQQSAERGAPHFWVRMP